MATLNRHCQTFRILLTIATIADEDGKYKISDAVEAVKKEYPTYSRIFRQHLYTKIHNFTEKNRNGYCVTTKVRGVHKIKAATIDQIIDDLPDYLSKKKSRTINYFVG